MIHLVDPATAAYWECCVEGCNVTTVSGAPGKKPRTSQKAFPEEWKSRSFAQSRELEKLRAGFRFVAETTSDGWYLALKTAGGKVHTGFQPLEYVPDLDLILTAWAHKEGDECELVFLDARSGEVRESLTLPFFDLWQIRADGSRDCLYFRVDGGTYRLDLKSRTHARIASTPPLRWTETFGLSRNGSRILLAERGSVVVRDLDTQVTLWQAPIPKSKSSSATFNAALSPSGELAAVAFKPGSVVVHNIASGETTALTGEFQYTTGVEFHPSGKFLAVTELHGGSALYIFDLSSGEEVTEKHAPARLSNGDEVRDPTCEAATFDPEGRRLFVRSRGTVAVYEFETGELTGEFEPELVLRPGVDTGFQMLASRAQDTMLIRTDLGGILVYRYGG